MIATTTKSDPKEVIVKGYCQACMRELPTSQLWQFGNGHQICSDCARDHALVKLCEPRILLPPKAAAAIF